MHIKQAFLKQLIQENVKPKTNVAGVGSSITFPLIVLTWWNPTSPFSEPHKSSWDMEMGDGTKWASKF